MDLKDCNPNNQLNLKHLLAEFALNNFPFFLKIIGD